LENNHLRKEEKIKDRFHYGKFQARQFKKKAAKFKVKEKVERKTRIQIGKKDNY